MTFEMECYGETTELRLVDDLGVARRAWVRTEQPFLIKARDFQEPFNVSVLFWRCVIHCRPPHIGGGLGEQHPYVREHAALMEEARATLAALGAAE